MSVYDIGMANCNIYTQTNHTRRLVTTTIFTKFKFERKYFFIVFFFVKNIYF